MKVRTLLNKLELHGYQTIRVLDKKVDYFIESNDVTEIVDDCGKSKVNYFEYSKLGDCFLVYINKRKQ